MKGFLSVLSHKLLYSGSSKLRGYEEGCLTCLSDHLSSEQSKVLTAQLQAVNLVQRYSEDKLVTFYFPAHDVDVPLFANQAEEMHAARLIVRSQASNDVTCDCVFHRGRISSLEFDQSPRQLSSKLECSRVRFLEDLSRSHLSEGQSRVFGRLTTSLAERYDLQDVLLPASGERVTNFITRTSANLVSDYVELLHETNGFLIQQWRFTGIEARKVVRAGDNCYFLFESEEWALCILENQTDAIIYLYDLIDDEMSNAGSSFLGAMEQALSKIE